MSSILKELNGLARSVGAPVDGTNISEQVEKLKGHMASDTMPYSKVTGKPKINNVTVDGNLSWEDLGIANPMHIAGSVATVADLANVENPQAGDVYLVGPSDGIKDEYCYTSAGTWEFIGDRVVVVDDALSTTSENPVQNKVVTESLNGCVRMNNNGDFWQGNTQITAMVDRDTWESMSTFENMFYFIYPTPPSNGGE